MSVRSGLPTWAEFLRKARGFTKCSSSALEKLIEASAFEEAADLLADNTNPRLLAERVEHDLRIDDYSVINGAVCLLPGLFLNLVITTNLDCVLERLYELCNAPFGYILSGKDIAAYRRIKDPKGQFLLKLHGDCERQESRVLLSSEYWEAYSPNSPVREELTLLYQQHSLLFLGCSLGPDRTVSLIKHVAERDVNMPRHYAFLSIPENDADRITREDFLTRRGIFPIWYDFPHDEAITALLDGLYSDGT